MSHITDIEFIKLMITRQRKLYSLLNFVTINMHTEQGSDTAIHVYINFIFNLAVKLLAMCFKTLYFPVVVNVLDLVSHIFHTKH